MGCGENAERGFFNGSRPPDGFHKVDVIDGDKTRHRREPDPKGSTSRQVVQLIFNLALKGMGCKEIAKFLNKEGYPTSVGQKWGRSTIHKILTNEAYCGTLVWGGRSGHPAIHSGTPPVRVENAWLAIIDRRDFWEYPPKDEYIMPFTPSIPGSSPAFICSVAFSIVPVDRP